MFVRRLLLSIDRGKDEGEATENVVLAAKCSAQQEDYCQGKIVGIDFSGNPNIGNVDAFLPALRRAKELGLKLSVHVAEVGSCFDYPFKNTYNACGYIVLDSWV